MSNRSTAENLMELVFASTEDDRQAWKGICNEMFEKVLAMANEKQQKNFNTKNGYLPLIRYLPISVKQNPRRFPTTFHLTRLLQVVKLPTLRP
jgi:hypothetical protein